MIHVAFLRTISPDTCANLLNPWILQASAKTIGNNSRCETIEPDFPFLTSEMQYLFLANARRVLLSLKHALHRHRKMALEMGSTSTSEDNLSFRQQVGHRGSVSSLKLAWEVTGTRLIRRHADSSSEVWCHHEQAS